MAIRMISKAKSAFALSIMNIKFYWSKTVSDEFDIILTVALMNFDLLSCYVKKVLC